MTIAPHVPAADVADAKEAGAVVRAAGLRLTAARRLLLEALFASEGPVSAERLARAAAAGPPGAGDIASAYRNLEVFEQLGLVRHMHLGHGPGLYAPATHAGREYLVCERCSAVRAVEPGELDDLRATLRGRFGFEARFTHFPLTGLCADCAQAVRDGPETTSEEQTMHDDNGEHGEHEHGEAHAHEHDHDGETHSHAHTDHDHEHTEHEHEHSHGDVVHSHPHAHEKGLEHDHAHEHEGEDEHEHKNEGEPADR